MEDRARPRGGCGNSGAGFKSVRLIYQGGYSTDTKDWRRDRDSNPGNGVTR